jgi:hypothetical protein
LNPFHCQQLCQQTTLTEQVRAVAGQWRFNLVSLTEIPENTHELSAKAHGPYPSPATVDVELGSLGVATRIVKSTSPNPKAQHTNMTIALIALLSIVSLFSLLFIVQRYRTATPAQRPQIVWSACGAVAVAATVCFLIGFR